MSVYLSHGRRSGMREERVISLSSEDVACWFSIFVMIVLLLLPPHHEVQNHTQLVVEEQPVAPPALVIPSSPEKQPAKTPPLESFTSFSVGAPPEKHRVKPPLKNLAPFSGKNAEQSFHPIILRAANDHQVDPALVKAIIKAESGYNPRAISHKGAEGLMQLMPQTAEELGVEDTFNPEQNIDAGVRYFKQLLDQFNGDTKLALAAYNAGSQNVRQYKGVPPFKATQLYIKRVFEYYQLYKIQMAEDSDRV
jgi:hypothetical protein